MIDPIGKKVSAASDLRTDVVRADTKVQQVAQVTATSKVATKTLDVGAAEAVKGMAAKPPVDAERVAQIRKAVHEGRFPIYPATIADRLIAFEEGYRYQ